MQTLIFIELKLWINYLNWRKSHYL